MNSGQRKEIARLRYELEIKMIDLDGMVAHNERYKQELDKYGTNSTETAFYIMNNERNIKRAKLDVEEAEMRLAFIQNKNQL